MSKYELILFDVDDTLLYFEVDQKKAFKYAFEGMGCSYTIDVLDEYNKINNIVWDELEKGKIKTIADLYEKRCQMLLEKYNIVGTTERFNLLLDKGYQNGGTPFEDIENTLKTCRDKCKLGAITNGPKSQQRIRLENAGLDKFFSYIFVSEEIGYNKPSIEFFNHVLKNINEKDKTKILVVGDSLTSDIQGGLNAKIDTCWFNRKNKINNTNIKPDYEIREIQELVQILI